MKFFNRDLKGTYGYIKKQFIFEIIKTLIMFAMALGIFFIGYFTLGTKRSLWSVIAVLGLLPACKSLVGVIMLGRFKSLSEELYNKYINSIGELPVLFENIITTSKKTYFLPIICCEDNTVVAYCKEKSGDALEVQNHLSEVLKNAGHKVATVKVFDKEEAFLSRAKQMNENLAGQHNPTTVSIFNTIKAVSL